MIKNHHPIFQLEYLSDSLIPKLTVRRLLRCPLCDEEVSRLIQININRRAVWFNGIIQEQNPYADGLSDIVDQLIGLDEDVQKGGLALQTCLVVKFSAAAATQLGAFEGSFNDQLIIARPDLLRYLGIEKFKL